ncbi:hypothetical protein M407DRAFT_235382 [Tulasnella calospora MUT 4182]|uniref:Uncharacterized protein n=1 Tax=Tulasnella calospora MUT 4182 TaxID=1051891 RepID=A0A0C3QI11_9AGAM|nr:hypothetical protein M407DRAFT_235382 [Tulasnella calospora MUT 4182]
MADQRRGFPTPVNDNAMQVDQKEPTGGIVPLDEFMAHGEADEDLLIVPEMFVGYEELPLEDGRKALVRGAIDWVTVRIPTGSVEPVTSRVLKGYMKMSPRQALPNKKMRASQLCVIEAKATDIQTPAVFTQALAEAAIVCQSQGVKDVRGCITNGFRWIFFVYDHERKRGFFLEHPLALDIVQPDPRRKYYQISQDCAIKLFRVLVDWVGQARDSPASWYSVPEVAS